MRDISKSGGTPKDLSIHDLDFVRDVFGEPREVSGVYSPLKDNNDYIVSNLIYDGFSVTVTGAWYNAPVKFSAEYVAVFERGEVALKDGKVYVGLSIPAEPAPIPETGDGMGLFVFAGLALISMLGMVVLKKREQF